MRRRPLPSALPILLALSLSFLLPSSCAYGWWDAFGRPDPVEERIGQGAARELPTLALEPSSGYKFIVATDPHFGSAALRASSLAGFTALAFSSGSAFALIGGDLANKGQESEYRSYNEFAKGLGIPCFAAIGNHDLYNSGWTRFRALVGPSYYRIDAGPTSIYVIDTANGTVGEAQLVKIRADMTADPKPKIVFSHYPIRGNDDYIYYRITNPRERAELLELFAQTKVKLVLAGHRHVPLITECGLFQERTVSSLVDSGGDRKAHCFVVNVSGSGEIKDVAESSF